MAQPDQPTIQVVDREKFDQYCTEHFLNNTKSYTYSAERYQRYVDVLRGLNKDKHDKHSVQTKGFRLEQLPQLGLYDVLLAPVRNKRVVRSL